jgi:hypothetical protein
MEKELERLYKKLWETKGARFIAAKRMEKHAFYSHLTISALSVYIISLNLTVIFENRPPLLTDSMITYSTICLSIFMLVISTIISSKKYNEKASKFHDCGKAISELYDKLCLMKNGTKQVNEEDIIQIQEKYHSLINKFDLNHSTLDFNNFKSQNTSEYKNIENPKRFVIFIWVQTIVNNYLIYYSLLLIPLYFLLKLVLGA